MPLLDLVIREAEEDYVRAAQRKAALSESAGPAPRRTWMHGRGAAVVTAAFGLLVALAAVQTARDADVQEASREVLIQRIDERRQELGALERRRDAMELGIADLRGRRAQLGAQLTDASGALAGVQLAAGFVAVSGPGWKVTVADNPSGSAAGRVRASDLRQLVNGLWRAGAEAITINGRRLSNASAIVNANISIQVNRSPLTPPYVVAAIGDRGLLDRFDASSSGERFRVLAEQFGFIVERQNEANLDLGPAPEIQLRLRYAVPEPPPSEPQEFMP